MVDYMKKQVLIYDKEGVAIAMLLRGRSDFIVKHIDCMARDEKQLKRAITFLCEVTGKNVDVLLLRKSIDRFSQEYSLGYSFVDYKPNGKNWTREIKEYIKKLNSVSGGLGFLRTSLKEVRKKKMC